MTPRTPCGHSEPESAYRDPDTGAHRTARCEGGRLVIRGTGNNSVTDGSMFITARPCPVCVRAENLDAVLAAECEDTRI